MKPSSHDASVGEPVPPNKPEKRSRFKIVAMAIKALQKWKNALSPKYVYGQKKDEVRQQQLQDGPSTVPVRFAGKTASGPATAASGATTSKVRAASARSGSRTYSDRPSSASGGVTAGGHHGHKGSLLFKSLPDPKKSKKSAS